MAGTIVSRTPHFALHRLALDAPPAEPSSPAGPESVGRQALFAVRDAWIGALIPKRWAKRSVTRNAIKRQIYAMSAALTPPLPQAAHVVRLRTGFDRQLFVSAWSEPLKQAVRGELQELFARAAR